LAKNFVSWNERDADLWILWELGFDVFNLVFLSGRLRRDWRITYVRRIAGGAEKLPAIADEVHRTPS
jgi:hypothetical protein